MMTGRRAYNESTRRDFCAEMDILKIRKFRATGGVSDEKFLIAETFLIMFANQFVDSYVYETMDFIKENKKVYRFEVKKICNEIYKWLDNFNKEYYGCMNRNSQGSISDMGGKLEDAFKANMTKLFDATYEFAENNIKGDPNIIARVLMCVMLTDWSVTYMKSRLQESIADNPILYKLTWMSHEDLRKLIAKLDSLFGTPAKINDLKIHAQFCKFQKLWCDPEFIAENLGNNQPIDSVDEPTCQMELRELFKYNNKPKN